MSLMAKNDGGERMVVPAGTYMARCYSIVDLGMQYSAKFGTWAHKVLLQFELPTEVMDDGRPMAISSRYTISLNEKASLRHVLESWLGRSITPKEEKEGFALGSMLGAPCLLSIIHADSNGKTYANIAGVMSVPKGTTVPDQVNPAISYDVENGKDAVYAKLPEWIRTIIDQSKEFNGEEPELEESSDTDVPFGDGPITDAQMQQLKGLFQTKGLTNQQFIAKLPAGVSKPSGLSQVQADRLIKELAEA